MGRLPDESRELLNLLELSSKEGEQEDQVKEAAAERDAYLTISKELANNPWADKNDKPTLKNLDGVAGDANDDSKPNGKASPQRTIVAQRRSVSPNTLAYLAHIR